MDKTKILAVMILASANVAFAEDTTTVTVGPAASVSVQSNGNTVSSSAGNVIIRQSGTGNAKVEVRNLDTVQSGQVSASAVVINSGGSDNVSTQVDVTREGGVSVVRTNKNGQASTIVVGDDNKNIRVDSNSNSTTIEVK